METENDNGDSHLNHANDNANATHDAIDFDVMDIQISEFADFLISSNRVEPVEAPVQKTQTIPLTCRLWLGNCLEQMRRLPDESVDLIAADLPYQVTKKFWDKIIPMDELWAEYRRILKPTGNIVLTGAGMFSAKLMMAAPDLYKYSSIWEKTRGTNFFHKDYRPLAKHEDVLVFMKGGMGVHAKQHATYNPQGLVKLDKPRKSRNGNVAADSIFKARGLKASKGRHQTHTNWPTTIVRFQSATKVKGKAPGTQKPVALMDWIIRTYSNPGDVVLDNCLGSGTTGVAALAAGRHFIGIELHPDHLDTASKRIRASAPEGVVFEAPANDDVPEPTTVVEQVSDPYAIKFATVCSGVEAVSLAWEGLGYEAQFFSEIAEFQSAFLAHRYPHVPNLGDMTQIDGDAYRGLDVLWGSTPCQAFSMAGRRKGVADARGNLTLKFIELANQIKPDFTVLENVEGLLHDRENAFGCYLAAICGDEHEVWCGKQKWPDFGYHAGADRHVAWRLLDAQYGGLPQRRERLFVVACPRNGPDPREVLFERGSPTRNLQTLHGERTAQTAAAGAGRPPIWLNADTTPKWNSEIAFTLRAGSGSPLRSLICEDGRIRDLTPRERERLMGWPDDYTLIPWDKGDERTLDIARNMAIGNSLALPDVRWLGERIKEVRAAYRADIAEQVYAKLMAA